MDIEAGQKYGRLTIVERAGSQKGNGYSRALWKCSCECGREKIVSTRDLRHGKVRSCGCLLDESRKKSRLQEQYSNKNDIEKHEHLRVIWKNMINRCSNPSHKEYNRYGGRGISVCNEWRNNSAPFIKWGLDNGYEIGLSIDRINNDGNYEPSNCAFITRSENAKKKKSSKYLTANGMTMTLCEWSLYLNKNQGYLGYWMRKYGENKTLDVLMDSLKQMRYE